MSAAEISVGEADECRDTDSLLLRGQRCHDESISIEQGMVEAEDSLLAFTRSSLLSFIVHNILALFMALVVFSLVIASALRSNTAGRANDTHFEDDVISCEPQPHTSCGDRFSLDFITRQALIDSVINDSSLPNPDPLRQSMKYWNTFHRFRENLIKVNVGDDEIESIPDCQLGGHVFGEWVLDASVVRKKSFLCCGWDKYAELIHNERDNFLNRDSHVCAREDNAQCLANRRGTDARNESSNLYIKEGGHSCYCDRFYGHGVNNVSSRERWIWKPYNCKLQNFDGEYFCRLLENRRIHFVGDSTMGQSYATLINMIIGGGGNCTGQIKMSWSKNLGYNTFNNAGNCLADSTLPQILDRKDSEIYILNTGAHLEDLGDIDAILFQLRSRLIQEKKARNVSFVYRTMHPGHADCVNISKPSPFVYPSDMNTYKKFHYGAFPGYDSYIRSKSAYYGLDIMDMSPLYSRGDSHPAYSSGSMVARDCLHYCLPGPLDLFSRLLQQMIYMKEI